MKTEDVVVKIKKFIKKDFGITLSELKKVIKKTHTTQKGSDHFRSKNGYSVFYTDNEYYMQGKRNGGGEGFYVILHGVGISRTIKI